MHIAYVDDSAQTGRRLGQGKLIGLGAAVFPEDHVKSFTDDFYGCFDQFSVPHEVEFKWSPDSKTDWFRANDRTEIIQPLREAILDAAIANHAKVFVSAWDDGAQKTMYGYEPEYWVIRFMYERIEMHLSNLKERGLIVFDKPGGSHKDEDAWISDTRELTDIGTEYVKSDAIIAPILTAPSHHHPHLQLADLIAGASVGAFAGNSYALALIPKLKKLYHRNTWGCIGGLGVKLYPDEICNLYHWVLGDDIVTRRNSGVELPYKNFRRFVEDDGL